MQGRLLNLIGGCTDTQGDRSAGASQNCLPRVIGDMEGYFAQSAWEVIRDHTGLFVPVGCDPVRNNRIEYTLASHRKSGRWAQNRDNGTRVISIKPQRTPSDEYLDDEWVTIIPNTGAALFSAMALHVPDKRMEDRDYLEKCTVCAGQWIDHIQGKLDDTPKASEWAGKITGSPGTIRELAGLMAAKKTRIVGAGSLQRARHGEMTHRAVIDFSALCGHIGTPGGGAASPSSKVVAASPRGWKPRALSSSMTAWPAPIRA